MNPPVENSVDAADEQVSPLNYADASTPATGLIGGAQALTRLDVATIALKLLGVFLLLRFVESLGNIARYFLMGAFFARGLWLDPIGISLFSLAGGLALIFQGHRFAAWMLPNVSDSAAARGSPSVRDFQAAALGVAGVIIIAAWAVPGLLYAAWLYSNRFTYLRGSQPAPDWILFMVMHLAQLGMGLFLFFGAKSIANFWQRAPEPPP